jgi:hypothetical protein
MRTPGALVTRMRSASTVARKVARPSGRERERRRTRAVRGWRRSRARGARGGSGRDGAHPHEVVGVDGVVAVGEAGGDLIDERRRQSGLGGDGAGVRAHRPVAEGDGTVEVEDENGTRHGSPCG